VGGGHEQGRAAFVDLAVAAAHQVAADGVDLVVEGGDLLAVGLRGHRKEGRLPEEGHPQGVQGMVAAESGNVAGRHEDGLPGVRCAAGLHEARLEAPDGTQPQADEQLGAG